MGGGLRKRHSWEAGSRVVVGARARTSNMPSMSVTLDVSKVSGWLKVSAYCRVARWAYDARVSCWPGGERAVGGGDGESRIAGKGFRLEVVGARARTANM